MTQSNARAANQVAEAYSQLFCNPCDKDLATRVGDVVSDDWKCSPEPVGGSGAQGLSDTIAFFKTFTPDLKYTPQEIIEAGDRVIVRSIVTGTPTQPIMGVTAVRSFTINAIEIHRIANDRIVETFRVEDWARALNQIA
jgi:predicted ester cyclase